MFWTIQFSQLCYTTANALNASNGVVRWIIPSKTGDYFETAAKYSDGNVFAAMDSQVFSINPLAGKINWQQYDINSTRVLVIGSPVFDSKTVYTVSREVGGSNRLMAADKSTGAFKYSTQPPYRIMQAFSVVNNRIYYMSADYVVTLGAHVSMYLPPH